MDPARLRVVVASRLIIVPNHKERLQKGLDHPLLRLQRRRMMSSRHNSRVSSWSRLTKEIRIHCWSRKESHRHQRDGRVLRIWSVVGLHQQSSHNGNLRKERAWEKRRQ